MFAFVGRNVLHQSGLRTTPLYYYNSQAMLVTFTLFRVLTIPILLYMLLTVIRTDDFYMLDRLGKALPFAAHCEMDVLNVRWICKILGSVRRMMSILSVLWRCRYCFHSAQNKLVIFKCTWFHMCLTLAWLLHVPNSSMVSHVPISSMVSHVLNSLIVLACHAKDKQTIWSFLMHC